MKKAVSFLLTLALLAGLLSAWAAGPAGTLSVYFYDETTQRYGELTQTDRVSLTLDGSPLTPDDVPALVQYPAGQNGRTLVPVRLIAERLGASVTWVPETRQVILLREESTIVLTLGSATALVNGQAMELPGGVPAGVVKWEGRESTMVPLRFVSEQLGATVDRYPHRPRYPGAGAHADTDADPRAHARHARRRRQGVCHRHLGGRLFPRCDHRHRPYTGIPGGGSGRPGSGGPPGRGVFRRSGA